ncbi:MAG: FKBP-type peptidyl-prolyl cis-trans isomerase [bacterium]|nr:FKBP-type peptidyl-prolyl cis-trans isomerase [bacterium]
MHLSKYSASYITSACVRIAVTCAVCALFIAGSHCGPGPYQEHASGLQWRDDVVGAGESPQPGDILKLHYVGKTIVGGQDVEFFDSKKRKRPVTLPYLEDRLIKGFLIGLGDMKTGGKRSLIVPPELGYGKEGAGQVIQPNATLYFEMELLEINKARTAWDVGDARPRRHRAGYQYIALDPGEGDGPRKGEYAMIKYHKYTADGQLLDTSDYYATPYEFHIGQPEVPASWNAIVPLMKPRARYRVIVPAFKLPAEKSPAGPGAAPQQPLVKGIYYDIELLGVDSNHLHQ